MEIDPYDPFFTSRGIDPEIVLERGYVAWTDMDYADVIDTAFADIMDKQSGSVDWLRRKASGSGGGIIITRHSPFTVKGRDGEEHPLVPEIRPNTAVESSLPKRHYHGPEVSAFTFLPTEVLQAFVLPGREKHYRLKFQHEHAGMSAEELREHERIWHLSDANLREDGTVIVRQRIHWHTLYVHSELKMTKHLKTKPEKISNSHKGVNTDLIHVHVKRAKYLFAPSESRDQNWDERPHNHEEMSESQLEWHLSVYHEDEGH